MALRPSILLCWLTALLVFAAAPLPLEAEADEKVHASSLHGAVKYPPDFAHFAYVNPAAPKGGRLRLGARGGFDSFNPFLIKGRPAGLLALLYDTLMTSSLDEPGSSYGLAAQALEYRSDGVIFHLRPQARFHDGEPVKPEDVIWSLAALKKAHPFYRAYYAGIARAEKTGARQVRFFFHPGDNRELPHIIGQLPILPRHYWQQDGRDFHASGLTLPLGSGPYRIKAFEAGKFIEYERADDYWGDNLPVNIGRNNFARIRLDYYGDDSVLLEAFKARAIDFRVENTAKNWATAYDALKDDPDFVMRLARDGNPRGMQAFVFNIRRAVFADAAVREALAMVFDFSWTNKNLFYGQYRRSASYFAGSAELAASGLPQRAELDLLRDLRARFSAYVPAKALEEEFAPAGAGLSRRARLRAARDLLRQSGWIIRGGVLLHRQSGRELRFEILLVNASFERIVLPYVQALEKLGVRASVRLVDAAQYRNRLDDFDFDMIVHTFAQSSSPGNEQRDFWGSAAADERGGRNLAGIKNPAIDALIGAIIQAPDRSGLIAAAKALDRVLLANHYVIPQWHSPAHRLVWWRTVRAPEPLPLFGIGMPVLWWAASEEKGEEKGEENGG